MQPLFTRLKRLEQRRAVRHNNHCPLCGAYLNRNAPLCVTMLTANDAPIAPCIKCGMPINVTLRLGRTRLDFSTIDETYLPDDLKELLDTVEPEYLPDELQPLSAR